MADAMREDGVTASSVAAREAPEAADATPAPDRRRHSTLFIVATIFIDAVGFGIIMPVLPQLVMQVARVDLPHAIAIGAQISFVMALASFLAAPVLGNLSDAYGRRLVLLIALTGLALDYLLLAFVNSLPMLFLARTLTGVVGGSFGAAQSALADIIPPEGRAKAFGAVGAAFGLGFIAGPAIGGLLGESDPRLPFMVAAGLAGLNMLYGLFVFPETLPVERRRRFELRRANPFGALMSARAIPGMLGIAVVLLLWQIASLVYPLTWSWYGIAKFGWSSRTIGLSLAVVGVVMALSQALLVGPAVKRLGERNAASIGLTIASVGFIGYAFASQSWMAFTLMVVLAPQAMVMPSLSAMLSRRATAETQGEVQGISAMIMGLGALVAPWLLTGVMARYTGEGAPVQFPGAAFLVAAGFGFAAMIALRLTPRRQIPPSTGA